MYLSVGGGGRVSIVGGQQVALHGNICMNVAMIDLSAVDGVRVGDEVMLIGKQGHVT